MAQKCIGTASKSILVPGRGLPRKVAGQGSLELRALDEKPGRLHCLPSDTLCVPAASFLGSPAPGFLICKMNMLHQIIIMCQALC